MRLERPLERRNRGQQTLLQADEGEFCESSLLWRQFGKPCLSQFAVGSKFSPEVQFRCVGRQPDNGDSLDLALGECLAETAQIDLQAAHHHRIEIAWSHLNAARKALRIEHL